MARRGCPICGKAPVQAHRPFCSKRCADIDLGRWFGEVYRIPVEADDDEADSVTAGEEETPPVPPRRR